MTYWLSSLIFQVKSKHSDYKEHLCLLRWFTLSDWGLMQTLAQQAKLDRAEEIKKELELCERAAAELAQRKYKKHFGSCRGILEQIVDLATKAGEYRLLTGKYVQ